jgi:hypothetical protein
MKEFCKIEQSFSLSLYHQLVLKEKRGSFFIFFIYKTTTHLSPTSYLCQILNRSCTNLFLFHSSF